VHQIIKHDTALSLSIGAQIITYSWRIWSTGQPSTIV
jgi:hypothetical protein